MTLTVIGPNKLPRRTIAALSIIVMSKAVSTKQITYTCSDSHPILPLNELFRLKKKSLQQAFYKAQQKKFLEMKNRFQKKHYILNHRGY